MEADWIRKWPFCTKICGLNICLNGQLHGNVIETESGFSLTSNPGDSELQHSFPTHGDVVKVSQSRPPTFPPTTSSFSSTPLIPTARKDCKGTEVHYTHKCYSTLNLCCSLTGAGRNRKRYAKSDVAGILIKFIEHAKEMETRRDAGGGWKGGEAKGTRE